MYQGVPHARLVLASDNAGKLEEFSALLASRGVEVVAQSAFGVPAAEENGASFIENALIKARNAARYAQLPALADDSGLAVDTLGGAPGIHSARFAGPRASSEQNMAKLLEMLGELPESDFGSEVTF